MATSKKEAIQAGLITRLETVTAANGYDTDLQNVFADEIPMGLDLDEHQLPAVLLVGGDDKIERQHSKAIGNWEIEIQLIHNLVPDGIMHRFVRDINKAFHANSPTAMRNEAFRSIHPAIFEIWLQSVDPDLGMIEANRFFVLNYMLNYSTTPYDL